MPTFFCRHCRFKYSPKSDRKDVPSLCGNCGTKGSMVVTPDADSILKDVNELM